MTVLSSAAETSAETSASVHTETAESSVSETTVSLYKFNKHTEENRTYVEITEDTPFYSCRYEQTGLCSGQDFTDTELLKKAKAALLSSQVYTELYNEVKQSMPDNEPAIDVSCTEVLAHDLDSDGFSEYAFLFSFTPDFDCTDEIMLQNVWGAIDPNAPFGLVLCDSSGTFFVSDMKYAMNAEIYTLNYGSFAQFVVSGGVSNNSSCADFFSFYDGVFEHELREFRATLF